MQIVPPSDFVIYVQKGAFCGQKIKTLHEHEYKHSFYMLVFSFWELHFHTPTEALPKVARSPTRLPVTAATGRLLRPCNAVARSAAPTRLLRSRLRLLINSPIYSRRELHSAAISNYTTLDDVTPTSLPYIPVGRLTLNVKIG